MSKVPLRARALDATKPMPVFSPDELPDLADYAAANRTISALPTGVDKEEEMELHLQQALSAQQAQSSGQEVVESAFIPVPEVSECNDIYNSLYTPDYNLPKLLIKVQAALNVEPEIPDYDMDKADEEFVAKLRASEIDITDLQFETVMDRLEKNTDHTVTSLDEAKAILGDFDDDIISSVYDYWLWKRVEARQALIPRVKTERRDGGTGLNPYVAFRRRAERMQTRKNRKNDEDSYEKILRLSQDLRKAVTLLEMVKRREKTKRELLSLDVEVLERRYQLEDWGSVTYSAIQREAKPSFAFGLPSASTAVPVPREPKAPKPKKAKRRATAGEAGAADRGLVSREWLQQNLDDWNRPFSVPGSPSRHKRKPPAQADPDGKFTFRRILGCVYYAPATLGQIKRPKPGSRLQPHPIPVESDPEKRRRDNAYESRHAPLPSERLHHLFLRSFSGGLRHLGPARARRGRGGRLIFDRSLDFQSTASWLPTDVASTSPPSSSSSLTLAGAAAEPFSQPLSTGHPSPAAFDGHLHLYRPRSPLDDGSVSPPPSSTLASFRHTSSLKRPTPAWNSVVASEPAVLSDSDGSDDSWTDGPSVLVERDGAVRPHRVRIGVSGPTLDSHRGQVHLQKLEPRLPPPSELADREPEPAPLSKTDACLSTSAVMNIQSVMKLVSSREPMLNNNKTESSESGGSSGDSSRSWNGDHHGPAGTSNGGDAFGGDLGGPAPAVLQLNYPPSSVPSSQQHHPLPTPSPSPTHSTADASGEPPAAAMKSEAVNSLHRARHGNQASPSLAISPPESITTTSIRFRTSRI